MNENINIVDILKDAPRGIELYSPICGTVLLCSIDDDSIEVSVKNYSSSEPHKFLFDIHGVSYGEYGECLLFPSKDNRDWTTFKAPWKHKHFEPFQKVLIKRYRLTGPAIWGAAYYSHYINNAYYTTTGKPVGDDEIIPYEGNEDKLGKQVEQI